MVKPHLLQPRLPLQPQALRHQQGHSSLTQCPLRYEPVEVSPNDVWGPVNKQSITRRATDVSGYTSHAIPPVLLVLPGGGTQRPLSKEETFAVSEACILRRLSVIPSNPCSIEALIPCRLTRDNLQVLACSSHRLLLLTFHRKLSSSPIGQI